MKDLRFQRLHLVAHREKRGRTVKFDPVATVLKGGNDFGKSSIAKSLYATLGASPAVVDEIWKSASVMTLLEFTVNGAPYQMLRDGRRYSLFEGGKLRGTYTHLTSELGPAIAEMLGVTLKLTDRARALVTPPPAYVFLPYYCDQDRGWTDSWSSFSNLGQFPNWKKEVTEYHAGITDDSYFSALEALTQANALRVEPARELDALLRIQQRAESMLHADIDVEYDSQVFSEEITALVDRVSKIAALRETGRMRVATLANRRLELVAQKDILERVRKELHSDYDYAVSLVDESVECPTCGQVHENSFSERFAIAQDEAKAYDLLSEVLDEVAENAAQSAIAKADLERISDDEKQVQALLTQKRGQVTFARMLERAGRKTFTSQLDQEADRLRLEIAKIEERIRSASAQLALAKSSGKRDEIKSAYALLVERFMRDLEITKIGLKDYSSLSCTLKETGSDRPRAVLAYMFAILHLIWLNSSSLRCPIVLDSPNQQDQDASNHLRMLEFIRDHRPPESQLVLCAVDDCGIDFGGSVVVLEEKDFALSKYQYEEAFSFLRPYITARDESLEGSW